MIFDANTPAKISRRTLLLGSSAVLVERNARADEAELLVVAHPKVDVKHLDDVELEAIFLTSRRYWSGTKPIVAFNLPAKTDPRVAFDRAVLRMDPEQVARYWIDRRIRGGNPAPRTAPDPGMLVRVVAHLPGSIGYAPRELVSSEVRVLARIQGGKVLPP